MEKKYAIILFKGKEYLCGHEDGCHYDVSCPVRTFTEGEDDFKIQESGKNRSERTFRYHGKEFRLVTGFYPNGWPVLSLESPDNGDVDMILAHHSFQNMNILTVTYLYQQFSTPLLDVSL